MSWVPTQITFFCCRSNISGNIYWLSGHFKGHWKQHWNSYGKILRNSHKCGSVLRSFRLTNIFLVKSFNTLVRCIIGRVLKISIADEWCVCLKTGQMEAHTAGINRYLSGIIYISQHESHRSIHSLIGLPQGWILFPSLFPRYHMIIKTDVKKTVSKIA